MRGIGRLLERKYGELVFGLVGGLAYFLIALSFIFEHTRNGGALLAFFTAPLIICFPAIVLIKAERDLKEKERFKAVNVLMWAHIALLVISLTAAAELIL